MERRVIGHPTRVYGAVGRTPEHTLRSAESEGP